MLGPATPLVIAVCRPALAAAASGVIPAAAVGLVSDGHSVSLPGLSLAIGLRIQQTPGNGPANTWGGRLGYWWYSNVVRQNDRPLGGFHLCWSVAISTPIPPDQHCCGVTVTSCQPDVGTPANSVGGLPQITTRLGPTQSRQACYLGTDCMTDARAGGYRSSAPAADGYSPACSGQPQTRTGLSTSLHS